MFPFSVLTYSLFSLVHYYFQFYLLHISEKLLCFYASTTKMKSFLGWIYVFVTVFSQFCHESIVYDNIRIRIMTFFIMS